jgi:ABC-type phosphate/phosphonate transport system substrate-binding protein
MIANARMYSVSPQVAELWRLLLATVSEQAGIRATVIEHSARLPIEELWQRTDMAAVFMCGLPFSRAQPRPALIAAPVPSGAEFAGRPEYWSEMVVREDSPFDSIEATFGGRLALTVPNSQSGYAAPLQYLMPRARNTPLYKEIIAPVVNPLGAASAVISGAADVAPVDAFAFQLLKKYRSDLTAQVRSIARTAKTPIPPLVASMPLVTPPPLMARAPLTPPSGLHRLRSGFTDAHRNTALHSVMAGLLLDRFVAPEPSGYDALRLNFEATRAFWLQHSLAEIVHPAFLV